MSRKYTGFSLLELIITLVIIGLLVGIVAPTFVGYQNKKRLQFSRDLTETALQKSFSQSRSEPRIFGVYSGDNDPGYEIFWCEYKQKEQCYLPENEKKETYILEPGIVNKDEFKIQFLPPHGDIDTENFQFPDENIITIQTQDGERQTELKIYKKSGFIEKYF